MKFASERFLADIRNLLESIDEVTTENETEEFLITSLRWMIKSILHALPL